MSLHLYILESASTGGQQRTIAGWPRLLEIDVAGPAEPASLYQQPGLS